MQFRQDLIDVKLACTAGSALTVIRWTCLCGQSSCCAEAHTPPEQAARCRLTWRSSGRALQSCPPSPPALSCRVNGGILRTQTSSGSTVLGSWHFKDRQAPCMPRLSILQVRSEIALRCQPLMQTSQANQSSTREHAMRSRKCLSTCLPLWKATAAASTFSPALP